MTDPDRKDLLQSKTFWGSLLAGLAAILKMFDISIDAEAYANDIATVAGVLVAMYGRISADRKIDSVGGKKIRK